MQVLAKFKKILYMGSRATLNLRKFNKTGAGPKLTKIVNHFLVLQISFTSMLQAIF